MPISCRQKKTSKKTGKKNSSARKNTGKKTQKNSGLKRFVTQQRQTRSQFSEETVRKAWPHWSFQGIQSKKIPPLIKLCSIGDGLKVARSTIPNAGNGLFATRFIPGDTLFTWYQGKLIDISIGKKRADILSRSDGSTHVCSIDKCTAIDGVKNVVYGSGGGTFTNHCETPNAKQERFADCECVLVRTIKPIVSGQEITIKYDAATLSRFSSENDDDEPSEEAGDETTEIDTCFTCPVCDERVGSEVAAYVRHINDHMESKVLLCDLCGRTFTLKHHLARHKDNHSESKLFKCTVCDKSFSQDSVLKRHMRIHNKRETLKCKLCDKRLLCADNLRVHMRTHDQKKAFYCDVCPYECTQSAQLTRHRLTHTGENNFLCTPCGQYFARKDSLRRHQPSCNKQRSQKDGLQKEKLFQCATCQKRFSVELHLRKHIAQYDKKFDQNKIFERHVMTPIEGKPFQCTICKKGYTRQDGLSKHQRREY